MGVIATLLPNPKLLRRAQAALRGRFEVVVCNGWPALIRACEDKPVWVAFVDLFEGGHANFDSLRAVKQRFPRLTLIAYVESSPERVYDIFDAGRLGMDGLIVADQHDTPRAFTKLVDQAESRTLAAVLRHALEEIDATARDAVLLAVTRAHDGIAPDELARRMSMPRRTLAAHLTRAGLPATQRLLTWGRLIVAAHLLEDPRRSAQRVASALHFPSGSAFRNTCQRYLYATPSEIRSRGGAPYVIRTLLKQVQPPVGGKGRNPRQTTRRARHLTLAI
ncbi:MAG: helix-turn-helix domain-containing protein [Gemmatimonadaceae bacterium]